MLYCIRSASGSICGTRHFTIIARCELAARAQGQPLCCLPIADTFIRTLTSKWQKKEIPGSKILLYVLDSLRSYSIRKPKGTAQLRGFDWNRRDYLEASSSKAGHLLPPLISLIKTRQHRTVEHENSFAFLDILHQQYSLYAMYTCNFLASSRRL